jgi:hypothetical protein
MDTYEFKTDWETRDDESIVPQYISVVYKDTITSKLFRDTFTFCEIHSFERSDAMLIEFMTRNTKYIIDVVDYDMNKVTYNIVSNDTIYVSARKCIIITRERETTMMDIDEIFASRIFIEPYGLSIYQPTYRIYNLFNREDCILYASVSNTDCSATDAWKHKHFETTKFVTQEATQRIYEYIIKQYEFCYCVVTYLNKQNNHYVYNMFQSHQQDYKIKYSFSGSLWKYITMPALCDTLSLVDLPHSHSSVYNDSFHRFIHYNPTVDWNAIFEATH